ncbi:MAG TPA: phosphate ABC transporter substrate-binding protein PstS [Anaeromyxobacteraceae bacterium]|nr:phosphate ABC transporter substrate-binding protein PstS [Anaeromyxobacteraceae bacterium]
MKKALAILLALGAGAAAAQSPLLVTGAGATFPFPLYSKWFSDYNKLHPDIRFNYQSIGSGGGIKQITERTVDFGASDAPMDEAELARAPGVVHVPTVLGAVVVTYSAPVQGLRLTPETLAGIFLGEITRWNDPKLAADNAGATLPDAPIAVAHRSDGSGTTYVFTDYLSKVSPAWKAKAGTGKSVKWPVGIGGKGNEGVTGLVKSTPNAIGYVELAYANQNKLAVASLKNADGQFVKPSLEATSAAAAGVDMPADFRVSITNARGKDSYPIASFTYLLLYKDQADKAKGEALANFLWWAIHDGQKVATPLDYAALPAPVVQKVERALQSLTVQGKPVSVAAAR